jgi:undecaprenyl-diphosphatase
METLNTTLFLIINGATGSPQWLVSTAIVVGEYVIYMIPLLLASMWLWGNRSERELAVKAFAVAVLGVGINQVIAMVWVHPRPFILGIGHTWITHAPDSSFPSDHVTVLTCVGLSLLLVGARGLGWFTMLCALSVAWARIFLGVHFPFDMLGAVGVATLSCVTIAPLWRRVGAVAVDWLEALYRTVLARPIARNWIQR